MNSNMLKPENLRMIAKKIHSTSQLDKVNAIFGFDIDGEIISSATGFLYKKPNLSKEIILRNNMNVFPDEITLLVMVNTINEPELLLDTIKQFRKKGIKIEKIVATATVAPEIEDELRVFGIGLIRI